MTPGSKWSPRYGTQYRRLCARAGCSAAAVATLRFQSTERLAWLVDLDDNSARTQGDLCSRHAAALVLPRGWELRDERSTRPAGAAAAGKDPAANNGRGAARSRTRRTAVSDAPPETDQLPGLEPDAAVEETGEGAASEAATSEAATSGAARGVPAQFGSHDDDADVVDDALDVILDARTPLLRRAFRNARPEPPEEVEGIDEVDEVN